VSWGTGEGEKRKGQMGGQGRKKRRLEVRSSPSVDLERNSWARHGGERIIIEEEGGGKKEDERRASKVRGKREGGRSLSWTVQKNTQLLKSLQSRCGRSSFLSFWNEKKGKGSS